MNDDELEFRLQRELKRRIVPPEHAPLALRRIVEDEIPVASAPPASGWAARRMRALGGLAAAAAVACLLGAGLMFRSAPGPSAGPLPESVETFSRIDANTAWAVKGSDLYLTRDGGSTWTKSLLPGGPGTEILGRTPEPGSVPTPCTSPDSASGGCTSSTPTTAFPNHFYPDFVDADHGWLASWTMSGPDYTKATYSLTVHRTSDGGRTWAATGVPGTFGGFGSVRFVDRDHGILTVYAMSALFSSATQSSQGGESSGTSPQPAAKPLEVPDATTVLATSDGGATWTKRGTLPGLSVIAPVTPTELWAVGAEAAGMSVSEFHLRHSTDGGSSWIDGTVPVGDGCATVYVTDLVPARTGDGLQIAVPCLVTTPVFDGNAAAPSTPSPIGRPSAGVSQDASGAVSGAPRSKIVVAQSRDEGRTWRLVTTRDFNGSIASGGFGGSFLGAHALPQPIVSLEYRDTGTAAMSGSFDGGVTWKSLALDGLPGLPYVTDWISPTDAWVETASPTSGTSMVSGHLYATKDGGRTWRAMTGPAWPVSPESSPTPPLPDRPAVPSASITDVPQPANANAISAFGLGTGNTAWAVKGSNLLISDDGGSVWIPQKVEIDPKGAIVDVFDADHFSSLVLTSAPTPTAGSSTVRWMVISTTTGTADRGAVPQQEIDVEIPGTMTGYQAYVHYVTATEAFAYFEIASADAKDNAATTCERSVTSDGGKTWAKPVAVTCTGDVRWTSPMLGLGSRVEPGTMLVTADGGTTWSLGSVPAAADAIPEKSWIAGLSLSADGSLVALSVAAGKSGSATIVTGIVSRDGGATWQIKSTAQQNVAAAALVAPAAGGQWFVMDGDAGVSVSGDLGASWTKVAAEGLRGFAHGLRFAADGTGWAWLDSNSDPSFGTLYVTRDAGRTWRGVLVGR